jgi:hypothetical protein
MVRLVFEAIDEFEKWIDKHGKPEKYECYVTKDGEVVMMPTKSTRPVNYGYMQLTSASVEKLKKKLAELGVSIFNVRDVEWAEDRPVGVKFMPIQK